MKQILKRSLAWVMVLALLIVTTGCSSSSSSTAPASATSTAQENKGEIVVWGWLENDFNDAVAEFSKTHPGYTFTFVPVQAADYTKKIQTALASGSRMPDIGWLDVSLRGKLYSLDVWENLEAAPYNLDRTLISDWLYPFLENDAGQICSLNWGTGIAGLAYKRDLAKEYFGTDDPKELEAMFPDWDAFIAKGVEVNEKSGRAVKMFASMDELMTLIGNQNAIPFAKDNTVNVEDTMGKAIEVAVKARDADIVGKLDMWSPAWNAEFGLDTSIFNIGAEWAPSALIKPNDSEGEGNWGLMVPPGGCINQGGTSLAICKQGENKEGAWEFLSWYLLSKEGAEFNRDKLGYNVQLTTMSVEDYTTPDAFFNGEDLGQFYYKEALPGLSIRPLGLWDLEYSQIITMTAKAIMQDSALTYETALEKATEEANNIING